MLVDDSAAVRDLMAEMLRALGAEPVLASGGSEAVELAQGQEFSLILMDLQMADVDGLTAAHLIRAQLPKGRTRPRIVALTADAFGRALAIGPAGGMDGFLVKPVRLADLATLLAGLGDMGRAEPASLDAPQAPASPGESFDAAVLRDLRETRDAQGRSLLLRMAPRIDADNQKLLRAIKRSRSRSELTKITHAAHRIRGNCLVLGARGAAALATRLEEAQLVRDIDTAIRELEAGLDSMRDTLSRLNAGEVRTGQPD